MHGNNGVVAIVWWEQRRGSSSPGWCFIAQLTTQVYCSFSKMGVLGKEFLLCYTQEHFMPRSEVNSQFAGIHMFQESSKGGQVLRTSY